MKCNKLLIVSILYLLPIMIFSGCSDPAVPSTEVTREQAEAVLERIVGYANDQDLESMCSFGASSILADRQLEDAGGWKSVPEEYPTIIDTYTVDQVQLQDSTLLGGRVLVLEGMTGTGSPYRTEFFVARNANGTDLIVQYPVYWSGVSIGKTDYDGNATTSRD